MNQIKTKILFDGNCIVCDYEVNSYQKIAPESFEIIDISNPSFNAGQFSVTPEAIDKQIHVLTPKGEVLRGVDAFSHIWSRVPKFHWAGKAIKWPIIYQIAKVAYEIFARNRKFLPKKNRLPKKPV